MGTPNRSEFAAFEEKVRRTVYMDNVSPQVTESVLKTALGQFGNVVNVHFIPNYAVPGNIPKCVLVEMEKSKEAKAVISELQQFPFMMSGMPRPVRARPAEAEMFEDRPSKPGKKISCRWLDVNDPDLEVAEKLKQLTTKHSAEAAFLLEVTSGSLILLNAKQYLCSSNFYHFILWSLNIFSLDLVPNSLIFTNLYKRD